MSEISMSKIFSKVRFVKHFGSMASSKPSTSKSKAIHVRRSEEMAKVQPLPLFLKPGTIEEEGESSDAQEQTRSESPFITISGSALRDSRLAMSSHSLQRVNTASSSVSHHLIRQDSYRCFIITIYFFPYVR